MSARPVEVSLDSCRRAEETSRSTYHLLWALVIASAIGVYLVYRKMHHLTEKPAWLRRGEAYARGIEERARAAWDSARAGRAGAGSVADY